MSESGTSCASSPSSQVKRVPVTQEYIAKVLSKEAAGEGVLHPAIKHFPDALYNSLRNLVCSMATKYSRSCGESVEDLAQDCWVRIMKDLSKFDPSRACVVTFATLLCQRALNTRYRYQHRHFGLTDTESEQDPSLTIARRMENASETVDFAAKSDVASALRALINRHPAKRHLVHAIFGNPDDANFIPLTPEGFPAIERKAGLRAGEASIFYRRVARPFLQSCLTGDRDE